MKKLSWRLLFAVTLFALQLWVGPPEPGLLGGFIGTALAIGLAAASAAGAIGSAVIGSHAANNAANAQVDAANYAADKTYQASQNALDFQKQQFDYSKGIQAPFIQTGTNALNNLGYLLGINPQGTTNNPNMNGGGTGVPLSTGTTAGTTGTDGTTINSSGTTDLPARSSMFLDANGDPIRRGDTGDVGATDTSGISTDTGTTAGTTGTGTTLPPTPTGTPVNTELGGYGSLLKGFDEKFVAPTDVTEQNDPGYQFRLAQGEKALQASAAAHGNLFTGGTGKALTRYGQDYASNEYGNVYSRAFNEYANRFNVYNTNQTNQYNRLANTAGLGQTSATQLGYLGQQAAQNSGNITLNAANQIGQDAQNAGAARASGYVGSANAWSGALNNGMNNLQQLLLLTQLGKPGNCHVAAELYGGWTDWRTIAVRRFLFTSTLPRIVRFAKRYAQDGERWAAEIRTDRVKRAKFQRLFDGFLDLATAERAVA